MSRNRIIIILSVFLVVNQAFAAEYPYTHSFSALGISDGLSQSDITAITQDTTGFIWLGTRNGLNRYDGYGFVHYKQNLQKSNFLSSNIITSLAAAPDGAVWVGTLNGLDRYNPETGDFTQYGYITEYGEFVESFGEISSIYITASGQVWVLSGDSINLFREDDARFMSWKIPLDIHTKLCKIAPYDEDTFWVASEAGLFLFSIHDKNFISVLDRETHDYPDCFSPDTRIYTIVVVNKNDLILGTNHGILRYNHASRKLHAVLYKGEKIGKIESACKTDDGRIWIGAQGEGLYMLDGDRLFSCRHNPFDMTSLSSDKILSLYNDRSGMLWVGTLHGGVNILNLNQRRYNVIIPKINPYEGLEVSAVMVEADSVIWMGVGNGQIDRISRNTGGRTSYRIEFPKRNFAYDLGQIMSIQEKDANTLWICTGRGLYTFEKKTGIFRPVDIYVGNGGKRTLFSNLINDVAVDNDGNVWCCSPGGLIILKDGKFSRRITRDDGPNSIPQNNIQCIYKDRRGTMWVAVRGGGLCRFTGTTDSPSFTNYRSADHPDSLSHDNICSIYEDSRGCFWVGTWGGGVNILDRDSGKFKHYSENDGLLDNTVFSIAEDSKGIVWFSTYSGLSSFDPETGRFSKFIFADSNKNDEVVYAKMAASSDGQLYVCCLDGLVRFDTDFEIHKSILRPVRIIALNSSEVTKKTDNVRLSYKEQFLTFEFSSFDFNLNRGTYYYRLEGLEPDWFETDRNSVSYSNITPGHYKFKVKYCDEYNNVSPETCVNVTIVPPFWATRAAYMLYFLFSAGIVAAVFALYARKKRKEQEAIQERMRIENEKEIYNAKMMFFTNISHDIRTPLTLILGPVQKLKSFVAGDEELLKMVDVMEKNGNMLLRLVNQLLDFRKIDTGNMKTVMSETDITSLAKRITGLFTDMAGKNGIKLSTDFVSQVSILTDADKVEKIICNFISNALRYAGSAVKVAIRVEGDSVKVSVQDDGPGISEEDSRKIFDRFYQTDNSRGGTGIGLNLSMRLAKLLDGDITIGTPESGSGSVFTLELPADGLKIHDFSDEGESAGVSENDENKPLVMVVDDNEDMRFFISSALHDDYRTVEAVNGKNAMEMLDEIMPDLVITDIMMPGIDGMEFTKKIRENRKLFNIPVVIVSAKTSDEDRIRCLEAGADAYISKPFSGQYLKLQVDKLIQLQQKTREQLRLELMTKPDEIDVASPAHKSLRQIVELMEENIDDSDFNVESLSARMHMSRMQLYRLIKNMLGDTPSEFIRNFRLTKAAAILEKNEFNVNEVAYMVGFNDPKYFTSCFKKKFGVLPRDYEKQMDK